MLFPRIGDKLVFTNYNIWSIRIRAYLGACNLWRDVIANQEKCILEKVREMKEKRTREILQGVMHEEVWKRVASFDSLPQLWNELEFICNNYKGPPLPKESWVRYVEEDEILVEEIDEVEEEESKNEDFEDICREAKEIDHDANKEFEDTIIEASFEKEEEKESVEEIVEIEKIEEEIVDENDEKKEFENLEEHEKNILSIKSNDLGFRMMNFVEDIEWVNMEKFFYSQELEKRNYEKFCKKFKIRRKKFMKHAKCEKLDYKIKKNKVQIQARVKKKCQDTKVKKRMKILTSKEIARMMKVFQCVDSSMPKTLFVSYTSMEMAKEFFAFEGIGRSKGFTTL